MAGSRFCTGAESRYVPVEGEAQAIVWALESTRHYTLGNTQLLVATDHKPLVKVFGDRSLGDISNPRLARLKEATLRWEFQVIHVPGVVNSGPDALSRRSAGSSEVATVYRVNPTEEDETPVREVESVLLAMSKSKVVGMTTWEDVKCAAEKDKEYKSLVSQVRDGFPEERKLVVMVLRDFWRHRGDFTLVDNVVMFKDRVVVPKELRKVILEALHAAHQGVFAMQLRADKSVWWPGLSSEISQLRKQCVTCDEIAPSQPSGRPVKTPDPEYPFQMVCSDFFDHRGSSYMVIVDRFSGWPEIAHCRATTGSSSLVVSRLREFFSRFGVPEELATDGARVYTSYEVEEFLQRYGVRHRVSSAMFPHSN